MGFHKPSTHRRYQRRGRYICLLAVICLFALLGAGCGKSDSSAPAAQGSFAGGDGASVIRILAAENFYGEAAHAVGGDRVRVESVFSGPGADPHDFDPSPDTAKAVQQAQIVIYNGLGYDDWMKQLIGSSGGSGKMVIRVGEDVMGKKDGDNEHIWYMPETMSRLAAALADKLSRLDPAHAQEYRTRAGDYTAGLQPLRDRIQQLRQTTAAQVAVSEPVFDYMLSELNLTVLNGRFAKSIEEETDPAPADLARLQDALQQKSVKFFVYNIQSESVIVRNMVEMAKANSIPVLEITETEPPGTTYAQWMTEQLAWTEEAMHGMQPAKP